MAKLCLNMIVKNEADKVERCLASVIQWIDSAVIIDTGSTDDTIERIRGILAAKGIKQEIHTVPFINFEQARNAALGLARKSLGSSPDSYIMFVDADMQLIVEDLNWKDQLTGPCYDLMQRANTLVYANKRLLRADVPGQYKGVTHEYLDVGPSVPAVGAHFKDYADGTNRKDKYERDINLLLGGLEKEPDNARYWFYLAQSYRDAGQYTQAAQAYKMRVEYGGWEEEAWNAQLNYAHCLKSLNDEAGFIRNTLLAYNMRPSRAESLYDLAKHYREKGETNTALMLIKEGAQIPYSKDLLFISDSVYKYGFREEFSIAGFYAKDPATKAAAFRTCDQLSLDRSVPEWTRDLAQQNLFFYLQPLKDHAPTFKAQKIGFVAPSGWTAMNPSVAKIGDKLMAIIRTVNYTIDPNGRYLIRDTHGEANSTNPINTRNYLVELDDDLQVIHSKEILPPADMPKPLFDLVIGFEDMRLFEHRGNETWISACVREMNQQGWCEQVIARINSDNVLDNVQRMLPTTRVHEKNWMPIRLNGLPNFVYKLGQLVNPDGKIFQNYTPVKFTDNMRGSGQVLPYNNGFLAIVHSARHHSSPGQRSYEHRFVWMDKNLVPQKITLPFYFNEKAIEFAAGLAFHKGKLVISYGVRDAAPWIATIDEIDLDRMLEP